MKWMLHEKRKYVRFSYYRKIFMKEIGNSEKNGIRNDIEYIKNTEVIRGCRNENVKG